MSYDTASTESLKQRLADTEETLAALRKQMEREQGGPNEPLWGLQEDIERFEIRRDLCLEALARREDTQET